jgi:NitT/TauT family transport system substrate-binding protein
MRRFTRAHALGFGGAALAAATFQQLPSGAQDTPALRTAFAYTDAFGQAGYAEAGGFFKQVGLRVQLVALPNSGAITAAAAGGALDLGLANPITLTNAIQRGLPFAAIAPAGVFVEAHPEALLVVDKASSVQTAKDLEGKTVALIEIGGITQTSMTAWLTKSGANPAAVHFVELSFSAMPAALKNRVDAAFISGPPLQDALRSGDSRSIGSPYAAIAPQWSINLWFATRPWLAANAATAHKFVQAIEKSVPWINTHPIETLAVMQQYAPAPIDASKIVRTVYSDRLDVALIQPVLDAALRAGTIKTAMNAHDLIVTV